MIAFNVLLTLPRWRTILFITTADAFSALFACAAAACRVAWDILMERYRDVGYVSVNRIFGKMRDKCG